MKVVLKSATTSNGALCAMTSGAMLMLRLLADSWDSLDSMPKPYNELLLARALDPFCLTMLDALGVNSDSLTAATMELEATTASTLKMPQFAATKLFAATMVL
jgi:hypothetical protein